MSGRGGGGQGGYERRIKVIVKMQKKVRGSCQGMGSGRVGGRVRVDVNEELKLL